MALTKVSYSMIVNGVVDVTNFGADPTGVADSTSAINTALAYARDNNKRNILIEGVFKISGSIIPNSTFFVMYGGSRGTTLRWAGSAGGVMLDMTGCNFFELTNINLDGDGIAGTGLLLDTNLAPGIASTTMKGTYIHKLFVTGCTDYSIRIAPALGVLTDPDVAGITYDTCWLEGAKRAIEINGNNALIHSFRTCTVGGTEYNWYINEGQAEIYDANVGGASIADIYLAGVKSQVQTYGFYTESGDSGGKLLAHDVAYQTASAELGGNLLCGVNMFQSSGASYNVIEYNSRIPLTIINASLPGNVDLGSSCTAVTCIAVDLQRFSKTFTGAGQNVLTALNCNRISGFRGITIGINGNRISSGAADDIFLVSRDATASVFLGTNQDASLNAVELDVNGNFFPVADNVQSLGKASPNRWSVVYAGTGTINTSDEREKTEILPISEAEKLCAIELKKNLGKFKFKDAVSEKGENARIHYGIGAQTVKAIFEKHGLDATKYALFCYDEWDARPDKLNEDGSVKVKGHPAGNRYGIRYEELLAFVIAAL